MVISYRVERLHSYSLSRLASLTQQILYCYPQYLRCHMCDICLLVYLDIHERTVNVHVFPHVDVHGAQHEVPLSSLLICNSASCYHFCVSIKQLYTCTLLIAVRGHRQPISMTISFQHIAICRPGPWQTWVNPTSMQALIVLGSPC